MEFPGFSWIPMEPQFLLASLSQLTPPLDYAHRLGQLILSHSSGVLVLQFKYLRIHQSWSQTPLLCLYSRGSHKSCLVTEAKDMSLWYTVTWSFSGGARGKEPAYKSSILAWRIPMDRGAWWATVHRVTKSRTRLKRLSTHTYSKSVWTRSVPGSYSILSTFNPLGRRTALE